MHEREQSSVKPGLHPKQRAKSNALV